MPIQAIILCGGEGKRLWPLSTPQKPKPFLPLIDNKTLLQKTVERMKHKNYAPPVLIANQNMAAVLGEHYPSFEHIIEPAGRNTAPAIAVAALSVAPSTLLLILPADHYIEKEGEFHRLIEKGAGLAEAGNIVCFGIIPSAAETGYGYIQADSGGKILRFCEKPDRVQAEKWVKEGGYCWNSGMFLFSAATMIAEMKKYAPDILAAAEGALKGAEKQGKITLLGGDFISAPAVPIDIAIMEKTKKGVMVPANIGWSDIGSWEALWQVAKKDEGGNVMLGDIEAIDSCNNYLSVQKPLRIIGLSDIVAVESEGGIILSTRQRVEEIKKLLEKSKNED